MPPRGRKIRADEPVMSDVTILVSVEDLINLSMGPAEINTVNYKMLQTVLHILARQLRLLETKVDIRLGDIPVKRKKKKDSSSESPSSTASPKREVMVNIREEGPAKTKKKVDKEAREKAMMDKMSPKEKEKYLREKEQEQKMLEKMSPRERDKYITEKENDESKALQKEKVKKPPKEKGKGFSEEQDLLDQMSPEERETYFKQKEIEEKIMKDMTPTEKEKYLKQKEEEFAELQGMSPRERKKYFKEQEKEQQSLLTMGPKEREKYIKEKEGGKGKEPKKEREKAAKEKGEMFSSEEEDKRKEKEKEEKALAKKSPKEKEKYYREKEALEKMSPAERDKYIKEKEKEEQTIAKMSPRERDKYLKEKEEEEERKALENMSPKEREVYLKEKEVEKEAMAKMSPKEREKFLKEKEEEKVAIAKMSPKERDKYLKEKEEEKEAMAKMSPKERDKYIKEKEKEKEAIAKMSPNEREKYLKEKEKDNQALEKMSPAERDKYVKEKEKEKEAIEKMSPKEREKYLKEKEEEEEVLNNMTTKEREKYLKEKEVLAKMSPKEREKYLKEKKSKATGSGTSIAITEVEHQNEKVLIVEKGPTTRAPSRSSIEVVTISQFNQLQNEVEELKKTTGPLPFPAMPDNDKLRAELAKGSASLTDTMQAMQVSARVQAAEEGLERMAGLLTQLAAAGALPEDFAGQLEEARADMEMAKRDLKGKARRPTKSETTSLIAKRKSVAIDASSFKSRGDDAGSDTTMGTLGTGGLAGAGAAKPSVSTKPSIGGVSRLSQASSMRRVPVTRMELDDSVQSLRDDLVKSMQQMTNRAAASAEAAAGTAKAVADKLDVALKLNSRISTLFSLTSDYAEQLSGFDAGLTTQMQSFQEQLGQMKADLNVGLATLETANNNAETAAVLELTERYMGLANDLESSAADHQHLTIFQRQLADELRGLVGAVEMLREQKADRDEVWDGLRDKADMSKLDGLVTDQMFANSRAELAQRLDVCYQKFSKQESSWIQALKDLTEIAGTKAQIMHLLSIKGEAQDNLNDAHEKLKMLEMQLGEPKAAILTRLLSKDGHCGACGVPALMEGEEPAAGRPPALPRLRPHPLDEVCVPTIAPYVIEDDNVKSHICNRWVGGSHTLVARTVPRALATAHPRHSQPVNRYAGYGTDGRMYQLAEELQPCLECNILTTDEAQGAGDGDRVCPCWPGVTDPNEDAKP